MRFQLATTILLVALAQCAHADSVSVFKLTTINIDFQTDYGDDNLFFSMTGPGTSLSGFGRYECPTQWCSGFSTLALGSAVFPNIGQLTRLDFTSATLGGVVYNPFSEFAVFPPFIAVFGQIVLPRNPENSFSACVPATVVGPIMGTAGSGPITEFTLATPSGGTFCTTWDFVGNGYQFAGGKYFVSTVPEPGTLGLMAAGVATLLLATQTKKRLRL